MLVAVIAVVAPRMVADDHRARSSSPLVGRPAPAIAIPPLLDDVPGLDASAYLDDGIKLLNVWASWCAPCRAEHPNLSALSRREGVRVFGVAYKDETQDARRFLAALGNPFERVGIDPLGDAAVEWGARGVPETFVIDEDGIVLRRFAGPLIGKTLDDAIRFLDERER